jgi:hypothetical protein
MSSFGPVVRVVALYGYIIPRFTVNVNRQIKIYRKFDDSFLWAMASGALGVWFFTPVAVSALCLAGPPEGDVGGASGPGLMLRVDDRLI